MRYFFTPTEEVVIAGGVQYSHARLAAVTSRMKRLKVQSHEMFFVSPRLATLYISSNDVVSQPQLFWAYRSYL